MGRWLFFLLIISNFNEYCEQIQAIKDGCHRTDPEFKLKVFQTNGQSVDIAISAIMYNKELLLSYGEWVNDVGILPGYFGDSHIKKCYWGLWSWGLDRSERAWPMVYPNGTSVLNRWYVPTHSLVPLRGLYDKILNNYDLLSD